MLNTGAYAGISRYAATATFHFLHITYTIYHDSFLYRRQCARAACEGILSFYKIRSAVLTADSILIRLKVQLKVNGCIMEVLMDVNRLFWNVGFIEFEKYFLCNNEG